MRHDDAYQRLGELVTSPSGEPATQVDAAVLAHAGRCATCAARLATLTRLDRTLLHAAHDDYPAAQPSATLTRRVLAIPTSRPAARPLRRLRTRMGVSATALLLAISLAVPLWLSSTGRHTDPAAIRTMPLHATRDGSLSGTVTLGAPTGSTRPLRLTADGLAIGMTSNYSIWLTGPDGDILIRSFSANNRGACDIHADAPRGRWSTVAITLDYRPPTRHTIIASAAF